MKTFSTIVVIGTVCVALAPHTAVGIEQISFVVEHLEPASSVGVGIDLGGGGGFNFFTLADDDNDGAIHLPPIPVGGLLALGIPQEGNNPTDICVILHTGRIFATIEYPLLASAANGASLGIDYGVIAPPPIALTPGDEFTVTGGVLPGWPGIRLVDDSGVPGLPEFVAAVDALPAFNGNVVVSNVVIRFTVVPEPGTALLLCLGALGSAPLFTWSRVTRCRHTLVLPPVRLRSYP